MLNLVMISLTIISLIYKYFVVINLTMVILAIII
jgi:hypothetical protein